MLNTIPQALETERLRVRPHRLDDLAAFTVFITDETATEFLALPEEKKTADAARVRLEAVVASYTSSTPTFFVAIADRQTDEYVGSCGIHPLEGDAAAVYYNVLPAAQGRGYATEATRALVDYAFDRLGAARLVAFVLPANGASVRVAEKLGFSPAGTHEQHGQHGIRYEVSKTAWAAATQTRGEAP